MTTSNTKGRIAELRKRVASNKGKYSRAYGAKCLLEDKMRDCAKQIRLDQQEIQDMGGKVRK